MHLQPLVALLLILVSVAANASEPARPMEREALKVREALLQGKFAEIEALEQRSRDLGITTSDGQPLRAAFFMGLGCPCSSMTRERKLEYLATARKRVAEWRKVYPKSLTALYAEAAIEREHGWAYRGQGYARDVPADAWPIFKESIAAASRIIAGLPETAKDDPEWYRTRLNLMREQLLPREEYEKLLDEGLKRHPRYLPIYFEGATFHSPRWGGSAAALSDFIDRAVAQLGEAMYARLHWSGWSLEMFEEGKTDWKRMKKGFERIVADHPDAWNLNHFANFACMAKDPVTTGEVMKRIEGIILDAWSEMNFYVACKAWVARRVGGLPKAPGE